MGRTAEMLQARRPACYRMDNAFAEKKQMVLADGFTGGNMPAGPWRIHFFLFSR